MPIDTASYVQALRGTLKSPADDKPTPIKKVILFNRFPVPVYITLVDANGQRLLPGKDDRLPVTIPPSPVGIPLEGSSLCVGAYLSATAPDGSLIAVLKLEEEGQNFVLNGLLLLPPNRLFSPPEPSTEAIIPINSPLCCVGIGADSNGTAIVHAQQWRLAPESHVLDGGESRTISYTTFSGVQDTSSSETTIAESLSASVNAGWGPIAASISGTLSQTTTTLHSLTLTTNKTRYESYTKTNSDPLRARMYLLWQLADIITLYPNGNFAKSLSIVSLQQPSILRPYFLDDYLPKPQ